MSRLAFAVLAAAAVLLWALVPTYPNYDAYYHLVWGRELLDGVKPTFEAYQAPTQHPLYLAIAAVVGVAGEDGDRLLVLITALSHVAFVAGVFRLGRAVFDVRAAWVGAALAGSSFALLLYAARAYVDIPFLALVAWAAALEAERPRRGAVPMALLALAGLLRPEAWVLAGAYWLWCGPRRVDLLLLAAIAPVTWALVDLVVTGDPLFSLHATSDLADELGRERGLDEVPRSFFDFLGDTAREPVAVAGALGALLAWRRREQLGALHVPVALFVAGAITFVGTGIAGLSILPRYLSVPAVALCLFAGYLVTRNRAVLALAVVAGLVFAALRAETFDRLATELRFIRAVHSDLVGVLDTPQVRGGLRCGPLTFPNYRLVPDARWHLELPRERVGARSAKQRDRGVAILVVGAKTLRRYGFADGASPRTNAPPDGFVRAVRHGRFTVYTACPR